MNSEYTPEYVIQEFYFDDISVTTYIYTYLLTL